MRVFYKYVAVFLVAVQVALLFPNHSDAQELQYEKKEKQEGKQEEENLQAMDYEYKIQCSQIQEDKLDTSFVIKGSLIAGSGEKIDKGKEQEEAQEELVGQEERIKKEQLQVIGLKIPFLQAKYSVQVCLVSDTKEDAQYEALWKEPITGEIKDGSVLISLPKENVTLEKDKEYVIEITLEVQSEEILTEQDKIDYEVIGYTKEESKEPEEVQKEEILAPEIEKKEDIIEEPVEKEQEGLKDIDRQELNQNSQENSLNKESKLELENKKKVEKSNLMLYELLEQEAQDGENTNNSDMIAHRGMSAFAPENTLPAIMMAGIYGYSGVELDVRETKDGKLVISHDEDVSRMTNKTGQIQDMTLKQIRNLTIDSGNGIENYSGLKVPTLEEALETCRQYGLIPYLDIKRVNNVKELLKQIKKYDFLDEVVIGSDRESCLKAIRKKNKKIPLNLINRTNGIEAIKRAKKLKLNGVSLNYSIINQEVVDFAKANNMKLSIWNVYNLEQDYQSHNYQADYIITNGIVSDKNESQLELVQQEKRNDNYNEIGISNNQLKQADSIENCIENTNTWYESEQASTINLGENTGYQYEIINEEIEKGTVLVVSAKVNAIMGDVPYFEIQEGGHAMNKFWDLKEESGWRTIKFVFTVKNTKNLRVLLGLNETESGIFRVKNISVEKYAKYNPEEIFLNEQVIEIVQGKDYNLQEKLEPGYQKMITVWKSSKKNIAQISDAGYLSAKKSGKTEISVTTDTGKVAQCSVIVKPCKMKKLKVKNKTTKAATLTWSKVNAVSGYEIYAKKPGDKQYKKLKTIKKNTVTSTNIKKLKVGKKYYYKIRAYKKIGNKKYYGEFSKVMKLKVATE